MPDRSEIDTPLAKVTALQVTETKTVEVHKVVIDCTECGTLPVISMVSEIDHPDVARLMAEHLRTRHGLGRGQNDNTPR